MFLFFVSRNIVVYSQVFNVQIYLRSVIVEFDLVLQFYLSEIDRQKKSETV